MPMASWPMMSPFFITEYNSPTYMWRSDPQMVQWVTRTMASLGDGVGGLGNDADLDVFNAHPLGSFHGVSWMRLIGGHVDWSMRSQQGL